jgi:hypothetical protein
MQILLQNVTTLNLHLLEYKKQMKIRVFIQSKFVAKIENSKSRQLPIQTNTL